MLAAGAGRVLISRMVAVERGDAMREELGSALTMRRGGVDEAWSSEGGAGHVVHAAAQCICYDGT